MPNYSLALYGITLQIPAGDEVMSKYQSVSEAVSQYIDGDGGTFSLHFGDVQSGPRLYPLFAVATPATIVRSLDEIQPADIEQFILHNERLLSDPLSAIGVWIDRVKGLVEISVTLLIPNKESAMEMATRQNEVALYDLMNSTVIYTHSVGDRLGPSPTVFSSEWHLEVCLKSNTE